MTFGDAVVSAFTKYAVFSGRARRAEFWYFWLFNWAGLAWQAAAIIYLLTQTQPAM